MKAPQLTIGQIAFNTIDLAGSLRLHSELFQLDSAGGNGLWGDVVRIHRLDRTARAMLWWMVNGETLFQFEYFTFSKPTTRPLPESWRADSLGWVRLGMYVPDLNAALVVLDDWQVPLIAGVSEPAGRPRSAAFRDPFAGTVIEMIELPSIDRAKFAYATNSVVDLPAMRRLHEEILGSTIEPLETLHQPEDEAVWGLPGARRDGFVALLGGRRIEVLCYEGSAEAQPPTIDVLVNQGMPNVGLATRDSGALTALIERLHSEGHESTAVVEAPGLIATYFVDPGCQFELLSFSPDLDGPLGFLPKDPFFGKTDL